MPRRNRCAPTPDQGSTRIKRGAAEVVHPPLLTLAPAGLNVSGMRGGTPIPPSILVVVTTVGTEEQALDIAHDLVGRRLAACVNIVPRIRSVFFWKGKVNDDTEWMLVVKTAPESFAAVKSAIKRLHLYELPEILGFATAHADPLFATWVVDSSTRRRPAPPKKKAPKKPRAR